MSGPNGIGTAALDTRCIALYYQAESSEDMRETFLASLPYFYNPSSTLWIEEFLICHVKTMISWLNAIDDPVEKPFLHRAKFCIMRLLERKMHVMASMHSYNEAFNIPGLAALIGISSQKHK